MFYLVVFPFSFMVSVSVFGFTVSLRGECAVCILVVDYNVVFVVVLLN